MNKKYFASGVLGFLFIFVASITISTPAWASSLSETTLITPGVTGRGADDWIQPPGSNGISNDGRITVFSSGATNIIPNDTNGMDDVFAYDRVTKKTELISHNAAGKPGNYVSYNATVSGDGRYVAYVSMAADIVPNSAAFCGNPTVCPSNVVVYDRQAKTSVFANITPQGKRIAVTLQTVGDDPPIISANGRFVAYLSPEAVEPNDTNNNYDVLIYDLQTHKTRTGTTSGPASYDMADDASISGDGRLVVFRTSAALVPEDTNNDFDCYLQDTQAGRTELLSVTLNGHAGGGSDPIISSDGSSVVFASGANNLVAHDTNDRVDAFLRDLRTHKTHLISVSSKGVQANGGSSDPTISRDGRFIVYSSWANNLVLGDTNGISDVFLYDRSIGLTRRINRASHDGVPANGEGPGTWQPVSISGDGKTITFTSDATNLTSASLTSSTPNMYLTYNPVVMIPFYDSYNFLELLR